MLQPREIKEDGVRFCARVQRLRVACEGGTSITRYIGQRKRRRSRRRKGVVGIAQGGREAGVRARVVERQIVRHLTHLIPYLTPSPVTTLIHPFLCYQLSSNVSPYTLTSLSFSFSSPPGPPGPPLHRPPLPPLPPPPPVRPSSRRPPPCRRLESFRLPTPYKRSCCPFITTTPATTTTERPTPLACFHPRASFQSSFSTVRLSLSLSSFLLHAILSCFLPFVPIYPSCTFPPSSFPPDTFDADRPRLFLVSSFCSQCAAAQSLLTL